MANYQTPGVYVEEIDAFPPSVAQVSTAIPAFIGVTEKAMNAQGVSILKTPHRIHNMLEYEHFFGGPKDIAFKTEVSGTPDAPIVNVVAENGNDFKFFVYHSVKHFFLNGGGPCYIISVGLYDGNAPDQNAYIDAFTALKKIDEVTLICTIDSVNLDPANYYTVCEQALAHCHNRMDRFAILDVLDEGYGDYLKSNYGVEDITAESKGIDEFRNKVSSYLDYGAAYYPYLQTTLPYHWTEENILISGGLKTIKPEDDSEEVIDFEGKKLKELMETNTGVYNTIKSELGKQNVVLPPCGAMAGIYARTDNDRGVWKAPANVAVSAVSAPLHLITNEQQQSMNIDVTSGKSINAIRTFTGKGVLVWGARTLKGNDNNWRYINVRRLFIMVEESCQKATEFAVFEPNDAGTWLKIKAMLQSFLFQLWQQGALVGPTPDSAYEVQVGLGLTMTAQDILEGRMNVEVKFAPSRPAEFIVLKFTQKIQQA